MFVKRQQARIFKEKMEHLTEEEAVVQVDFAENLRQLEKPVMMRISTLQSSLEYLGSLTAEL